MLSLFCLILSLALSLSLSPSCLGMHVGDERHYVIECLAFEDICRSFQHLFGDVGPCIFAFGPHARGCLLLAAAP